MWLSDLPPRPQLIEFHRRMDHGPVEVLSLCELVATGRDDPDPARFVLRGEEEWTFQAGKGSLFDARLTDWYTLEGAPLRPVPRDPGPAEGNGWRYVRFPLLPHAARIRQVLSWCGWRPAINDLCDAAGQAETAGDREGASVLWECVALTYERCVRMHPEDRHSAREAASFRELARVTREGGLRHMYAKTSRGDWVIGVCPAHDATAREHGFYRYVALPQPPSVCTVCANPEWHRRRPPPEALTAFAEWAP